MKYKLIDQNRVLTEIRRINQQNIISPTPTVFVSANVTAAPEPTLIPTPTQQPVVVSNEFKINIPKIGANTDIVSNVSPYNKQEYLSVLKDNKIAHSNESSLPDKGIGTAVYLFAHSSQQGLLGARDNSAFYLLGELNNGDDILINYRGKTLTYRVYMEKVIKSKETEYLNYSDKNKEILILQTCWPIGTNWQRLLVFAERI